MTNQKYEKWVRWFEVVKTEVVHLCHNRQIYISLQEIAKTNTNLQIESAFWGFLTASYASFAAVAVRRLVKAQKGSISFVGLIQDMAENPGSLTVDIYKDLYKGSVVERFAESDFRRFSDTNGEILDVAMLQADIAELKAASDLIEDFADKRVAHRDKRDLAHTPTFDDLHKCIDVIEQLACKYQLMILAASSTTMTPVIQNDWKAVFRVPWIAPN